MGSVTTSPRIGFVGLGNMGGPMCGRLADAGLEVHAFDVDDAALGRAVARGARCAESAAACAASADLLLTSLPKPEHVEAVMAGPSGALAAMRDGALWVDLTTNRPSLLEVLAAAAPRGVGVLDAPVTGAVDGARNGRLTLFVGGEAPQVARVTPVLSHLGTVIHCGLRGTGTVVKLVTNQLWFVGAAAIGEGFAVGIAHGVELGTLWRAILASVGDSFVARHDAPSVFAGHYDPSFTLGLCAKDLGLIGELAARVGAELPMTDAATRAFATAVARYGPDAAELHVVKRIEDDAGLSMRLPGDWPPPWER